MSISGGHPGAGALRPGLEATAEEASATVLTFDDFFRLEYPRLVTLVTAATGRRTAAEEIAQEAMLRAHVRWDRIAHYDQPGAWVRRVALNLASHSRARRRSEQGALDRLGRQRPPDDPYGFTDDFWAVVRTLPRRQAAAVILHYLDDQPVAQVAAILGCAEGTAKAHLHKARASLAHLLDHPEGH